MYIDIYLITKKKKKKHKKLLVFGELVMRKKNMYGNNKVDNFFNKT